jgi:hypothetical protein
MMLLSLGGNWLISPRMIGFLRCVMHLARTTGRGYECLGQPRGRPQRLLRPNQPPHPVQTRRHQLLLVQRRLARQQLIQQHPQRVNVAARVDVQRAHLRLLRTHIRRRADELLERREHRFVRQHLTRGGLGNTEVDDFGDWPAVAKRDQDVRGL